jgi:1,4-alpha-glucan branching enzyme
MGGECAREREWDIDRALDWELLEQPPHGGIQALVRDLNGTYARLAALHERDCDSAGFAWVDCSDHDHSVIAFLRLATDTRDHVLVVCNFTPLVRYDYCIGMPWRYLELLDSDAQVYGGSGVGNLGAVSTETVAAHGRHDSIRLTLSPLAALLLVPDIEKIDL